VFLKKEPYNKKITVLILRKRRFDGIEYGVKKTGV
jgi:hypothetical protein